MKWSVGVAVLVALGAAAGGGYYVIHQRTQVEVRVDPAALPRAPANAEQVTRDIGTYQNAKHPRFPEAEKQE